MHLMNALRRDDCKYCDIFLWITSFTDFMYFSKDGVWANYMLYYLILFYIIIYYYISYITSNTKTKLWQEATIILIIEVQYYTYCT